MAEKYTSNRIWIPLTGTFLVSSLALAATVAYLKISSMESAGEMNVTERFPGLLLTEEQKAEVERKFRDHLGGSDSWTPAVVVDDVNLTFSCQDEINSTIEKSSALGRLGNLDHNACCLSSPVLITPDWAIDLNGTNVTLVQLPDERQYFWSQNCSQDNDCSIGCRCALQDTAVRALIRDPQDPYNWKKYYLDYIYIPGCCKCFNNLPC